MRFSCCCLFPLHGLLLVLLSLDTSLAFQTLFSRSVTMQPVTCQNTFFSRSHPSIVSPSSSTTALRSTAVLTTAFSALDTFWQTSPYAAAAIICGFKASCADLIAQKRDYRKREEKERRAAEKAAAKAAAEEFPIYNPDPDGTLKVTVTTKNSADWKRNIGFLIYGSMYQGMAQEFVYNHLYPVWFGTATSIPVVLAKVLFDLLVQTTLVTLPIAYLTKSVIYRYSVKEALRRYMDDIRNHGLLKKYYLLWGPVQMLTFSVVPEHLRVTFIAFVSFFWLIILSSIASKKPVAESTTETSDEVIEECALEDGLTCNIDG